MCLEVKETKHANLDPVHTTPFLYKNEEKNLRFCESVHTDPHKNATKTEVFRKRSQKWISTKTEVFENAFDQCERTKTEVFLTVFVRKRSSVNGSFDATKTDTYKNGVV